MLVNLSGSKSLTALFATSFLMQLICETSNMHCRSSRHDQAIITKFGQHMGTNTGSRASCFTVAIKPCLSTAL